MRAASGLTGLVALAVLALDLVTKEIFVPEVLNSGAVCPWSLLLLGVSAASLLRIHRSPLAISGIGIMCGGALGNTLERSLSGAVRDWIPLPLGDLYINLADVGIVGGLLVVIIVYPPIIRRMMGEAGAREPSLPLFENVSIRDSVAYSRGMDLGPSCPECGHSLRRFECAGCGWRGERHDRAYLRRHFPRFPIALAGLVGTWAVAGSIGGIALPIALVWSAFFVGLIALTVRHAERIGRPVRHPELVLAPTGAIEARAEELYDCSYEDLVEQYEERHRLLAGAPRSRRRSTAELVVVAEERLRRVAE